MPCKICSSEAEHVKTLTVRGTHQAEYYLCKHCGFMFVGNPAWLAEAYKEPINTTDTGYVMRNVYTSRKTLILFLALFGTKHAYLDYAGGYGMFARLMRDYGFDFYNDDAYAQNLFAKSFEYAGQPVHALTCFECFEHLSDPKAEIDKMFAITKNIFCSTVLFDGNAAPADDWEYYGLNHGQHVAFYSKKTLDYIAQQHGVHVVTDGANLHFFSEKQTPSWLYRGLLFMTKFQIDALLRKFLTSKTTSDSRMLKQQGKI